MTLRNATLLAAALVVTTCGAAATPTLREIASIDQLEAAFERNAGKPRLVLLLSPT